MIKADFHMHTAFSTDSDTPAEEMILGAIDKGLETICITDHHDQDFPYYEEMGEGAFLLEMDSYVKKLCELRENLPEGLMYA